MAVLNFSNRLHLALYVECSPGTSIEDAFIEAVDLATRINVLVRFMFNEVDCAAFPKGNVQQGVKEYHQKVSLTSPYKFAHARAEDEVDESVKAS